MLLKEGLVGTIHSMHYLSLQVQYYETMAKQAHKF